MALEKGRFLIDDTIDESVRKQIVERVGSDLEKMKSEMDERRPVLEKRADFFEGRHHKWTNVVGQAVKQQEGHILATFNYIGRFSTKLQQTLSNNPPRIKIVSKDESNEIETARAEAVEEAIHSVFKENKFFKKTFPRICVNQVRDGDFIVECKVLQSKDGKRIVISSLEDLAKISVGWDDTTGDTFSFISYSDMWSVAKIKREFGYEAEPMSENDQNNSQSKGNHLDNQYGQSNLGMGLSGGAQVPTGQNKLPKAKIVDYWGYEVIDEEVKVVNLVFVNQDNVQFIVTDYKRIPRFIGHSFLVAGKPWSMGFIDQLVDAQIELNDRTSEEGDLIRIGSHMKFLAINMTDFDASSVRPGSGQVIFIEGEGADFRPLQMNITPFPSESYLNRVENHLFNLGIPRIALSAGTAPYTGRVGAIQYQSFSDLIDSFRTQHEVVFEDLIRTIQEYFIDYFPESHGFMREALESGEDGELVVRDVEFDWENPLPLSRSDKVVDASTMRDRGAISLHTYLGEAGFRDPGKEIKKMKKEAQDEELMVLQKQFSQFAPGAVKAQLDANRALQSATAESADATTAASFNQSEPTSAPILNQGQNDGRRSVPTSSGSPNGQTASPQGALKQFSQNQAAKMGG